MKKLFILLCSLSFINMYASLDQQLLDAVKDNNLEVVQQALKGGADINAKDRHGFTALIWAAYNNNLNIITYLVEKGADINAKNNYASTALIIAANKKNLDMVTYLVKKGADINAKNRYGFTALIMASLMNNLDIVTYLVNKGADINVKDNKGYTALDLAQNNNYIEVAEYLQQYVAILELAHKISPIARPDSFNDFNEVKPNLDQYFNSENTPSNLSEDEETEFVEEKLREYLRALDLWTIKNFLKNYKLWQNTNNIKPFVDFLLDADVGSLGNIWKFFRDKNVLGGFISELEKALKNRAELYGLKKEIPGQEPILLSDRIEQMKDVLDPERVVQKMKDVEQYLERQKAQISESDDQVGNGHGQVEETEIFGGAEE